MIRKKDAFQTESVSEPGKVLVFAMAGACGIAVANVYYTQPMLGVITRSFPSEFATSLIPTATQFGYAIGLLFLVPLGDLMERRRLIVSQSFFGLIVAFCRLCIYWSGPAVRLTLHRFQFLSVAQIIPAAASLTSDNRRDAVIGSVMSGLLSGILLSRILAGFIAIRCGWRVVFWLGIPLVLTGATAMTRLLLLSRPATSMKYGPLVRSLLQLWRDESRLRQAALTKV